MSKVQTRIIESNKVWQVIWQNNRVITYTHYTYRYIYITLPCAWRKLAVYIYTHVFKPCDQFLVFLLTLDIKSQAREFACILYLACPHVSSWRIAARTRRKLGNFRPRLLYPISQASSVSVCVSSSYLVIRWCLLAESGRELQWYKRVYMLYIVNQN